jgi:anti-anti-sigma factor
MSWSRDPVLRGNIARDGTASATIRLAGEIDITSVEAARRAVTELETGTRRVVVLDLSRVIFCDLAGIRFLIAARQRAGAAGGA